MKRREPMQIGDIIAAAMRQTGQAETFSRQRASALWPEVVGRAINRQTAARWISGTELHVSITSAPLRNDLRFLADSIRDKINDLAGTPVITRLVIH